MLASGKESADCNKIESERTELAEGVESAPWDDVDIRLSLRVEYLGGFSLSVDK